MNEAATAKLILYRIRKGDLAEGFTARDVHQKAWSGLTDIETVKAGLDLLADLDWIEGTTATTATGGRPRTAYTINPRGPR